MKAFVYRRSKILVWQIQPDKIMNKPVKLASSYPVLRRDIGERLLLLTLHHTSYHSLEPKVYVKNVSVFRPNGSNVGFTHHNFSIFSASLWQNYSHILVWHAYYIVSSRLHGFVCMQTFPETTQCLH